MAPADRRRRRALSTLTLALVVLTGCTSGGAAEPGSVAPGASEAGDAPGTSSTPRPKPSRAAAISSYAALGDSYTAAPFVPTTDLAGGCLRSDGNYPSLLAERLGIDDVRDVSCSAAESMDVTRRQRVARTQGRVPAQLRAVTPRTDLVTIGIGGNDERLFATLVGCVGGGFGEAGPRDRSGPPRSACLGPRAASTAELVDRTGTRVTRALRVVAARAPDARVVLVGYPRLLGRTGGCAAFPIDEADLASARALERVLRSALAAAAKRAGVDFLDTYALSAGHAICSDDPWVNGRRTDQSRALAFHPFAEEQAAVAAALARLLRSP